MDERVIIRFVLPSLSLTKKLFQPVNTNTCIGEQVILKGIGS